ncbi:hypothetical protein Tco_0379787, partial [Tanacetum coccineum]
MKKLIAELPMLTAPKEREDLIVYLAAAKEAISVVLMIAIKGQILADFIMEQPKEESSDELMAEPEEL